MIDAAACGIPGDRETFARCYEPVVRAYLTDRWRNSLFLSEVDDALQEVFLECFKQDGVLARADRDRSGGFRPFLYGVARHVAQRIESSRYRQQPKHGAADMDLDNFAGSEERLSRAFDRAWAKALVREAAERMRQCQQVQSESGHGRAELLRLRYHENMPIREIATRWQVDPVLLHREYAKARKEFKLSLLETIAFHHPGEAVDLNLECANLLSLLA